MSQFTAAEERAARDAGYKNFQQMMDAQAARRRQMKGPDNGNAFNLGGEQMKEAGRAAKTVSSGPFALIDYVTRKYKEATGQ